MIIYLNGPSSVGKTTLGKALQQTLREPFLLVGIDQLIDMMPEWINSFETATYKEGFYWDKEINDPRPLYRIKYGPFAQRITDLFIEWVSLLASRGFNLIIDDISFGKKQVDRWRNTLGNYQVLWIGLTAPEQILEQREKGRGDRKIGSTRAQYELVHKGVDYDLVVDTHQLTLAEQVDSITRLIITA